jgi:prepilin-type N-terminal cleavage/methylation domain-containing protein
MGVILARRRRIFPPSTSHVLLYNFRVVSTNVPERSAFTLLELLVVIGIMSLLLVAVVPAVTSLSNSNNLNAAGRMVANSLAVARSEAINQRTLIRFEVVTDWPNDPAAAYRKFTLVQHDLTTGIDKQLTKWETLPEGLIFNPQDPTPGSGSYFFSLNQTQNPKLTSGGQQVTTTYIEFLPTGALNVAPSNSPVRLRLVQGYLPSPGSTSATLTGASNWFEASVDSLVGRIRIVRP